MLDKDTGDSLVPSEKSTAATITRELEEDAVEALLVAQRAHTPIAVAVTQDYTEVPFKVPRKVVVLGWFWLIDAWVSLL